MKPGRDPAASGQPVVPDLHNRLCRNQSEPLKQGEDPDERLRLGRLLARLALDAYPAFLVPSRSPFGPRPVVHENPANKKFQEMVQEDPTLGKIFTSTSAGAGPAGMVLRSTGSGGDVQLWTLASTLIGSGWRLAQSRTASVPTPEELVEASMEQHRALCDGFTELGGRVTVHTGLTGVLLPEGTEQLELDWGRIRRADRRDATYSTATSLDRTLTIHESDDQALTIKHSGDLVFEASIPFHVSLSAKENASKSVESLDALETRVREQIESLEIALLIANTSSRRIITQSWKVAFDPLSDGPGTSWLDVTRFHGIRPLILTREEAEEWVSWAKRINNLRTPSVDIAIRRMLMSVRQARTVEDILVDAVIVWENLFGDHPETTDKVTRSLAHLLRNASSDFTERRLKYRDVYNIRSMLVHGSPDLDPHQIAKYADEAIGVSIDALRALFTTHSELLAARDSAGRGRMVRSTRYR